MRHLKRSVVDQYVESAELGERTVDHARAVPFVLDVAGNLDDPAARRMHPPNGFLGVRGFLGEVADDDVRSLARVGDCDSPPDSTVTTGDERDPVRQSRQAAIGLFAMIRARVHPAVEPGRLLRALRVIGFRTLFPRVSRTRVLRRAVLTHEGLVCKNPARGGPTASQLAPRSGASSS